MAGTRPPRAIRPAQGRAGAHCRATAVGTGAGRRARAGGSRCLPTRSGSEDDPGRLPSGLRPLRPLPAGGDGPADADLLRPVRLRAERAGTRPRRGRDAGPPRRPARRQRVGVGDGAVHRDLALHLGRPDASTDHRRGGAAAARRRAGDVRSAPHPRPRRHRTTARGGAGARARRAHAGGRAQQRLRVRAPAPAHGDRPDDDRRPRAAVACRHHGPAPHHRRRRPGRRAGPRRVLRARGRQPVRRRRDVALPEQARQPARPEPARRRRRGSGRHDPVRAAADRGVRHAARRTPSRTRARSRNRLAAPGLPRLRRRRRDPRAPGRGAGEHHRRRRRVRGRGMRRRHALQMWTRPLVG